LSGRRTVGHRPDDRRRLNVELDDSALEATALPLGEPAPDAEPFVVRQRILQAPVTHLAAHADALGLASRSALFREKSLRVGLSAQCALLPLIIGGCRIKFHSRRLIRHQTQLRTSCSPHWGRAGNGVTGVAY